MVDYFAGQAGLDSPAGGAEEVTPDDSTDLPIASRALYVGAGGNVEVVTVYGQQTVFVGVPTGSLLPVRAARVRASNTTATNIVALW